MSMRPAQANIDLRMQRDKYTDEYRVAVLIDGKLYEPVTYYTDDFEDCKGTRNVLARGYRAHGHLVDTQDKVNRVDFETWGKRHTING